MPLPHDKIEICKNCDIIKGSQESAEACPVLPSYDQNVRPGTHIWTSKFKPKDTPVPRHRPDSRY